MKNIRCSSLDSLFDCPQSVLLDTLSVGRPTSPAAEMGNVCHAALASYISSDSLEIDSFLSASSLDAEAARDEAMMLVSYGTSEWSYGGEDRKPLSAYFSNPQLEASIEGPTLSCSDGNEYRITGTVDCCSPAGIDEAIFLDWKSGYIEDGYQQQMAGYAYLIWNHMGRPVDVTITGITVFLRGRYYNVVKFTDKTIVEWENNLIHNILPSKEYSPGSSCRFCPVYAACEARSAVVRRTIDDVMGTSTEKPDEPGWMDRAKDLLASLDESNKSDPAVAELVSDMLFRVRLISQVSDNAKAILKEAITRVGPIPLSDDSVVGLRSVERKKLDPMLALPVLRRCLSETQLAKAMRLSLPDITNAYASSRPRGKKGAAVEEITQHLRDAGAISITEQFRMEQMSVPKPEPEEES